MKPTHMNVVMSMIFMYILLVHEDVLTLDQLHESLSKYEIRPRRKRKSRAKPYYIEVEIEDPEGELCNEQ